MISQEQAYELMVAEARPLDGEAVGLGEAVNRVLAEDVHSDMDMPPFDKAAMDGYACRRQDLGNQLRVVEFLKAGDKPGRAIGAGECTKIMTGSAVPEGADCVIMVEQTEEVAADTIRFTAEKTADNVCLTGEDMRQGDRVLEAGRLLRPQEIGILATVGCVRPVVARRPRVAVIATGNELVEPDVIPDVSQIRTSGSHQLVAQVLAAGALPVYYGIALDTEASLDATMKKAASENDLVLLSGGVSKGEYDLVPDVMKANGFRIVFDEIAVQPGRPTTFAVSDASYCVGLPGNPVATFTQFEMLVKPFLYKLMRHDLRPSLVRLPMGQTRTRARTAREGWFPARITDEGTVVACEFHGSAHIDALCEADCLGNMPLGVGSLAEGELVTVRLL